jgi:CheY-like chemotaxis protein
MLFCDLATATYGYIFLNRDNAGVSLPAVTASLPRWKNTPKNTAALAPDFWFRCRLARSHPAAAMPRILVIDDQPDVRAMISIVLRINHFEIVEAASGDAGLKEFENSRFDLVIVDIFLQGTNGFDVISMMRERMPDLPIVAISGMTTLDFLSESPELSKVICLQKPFRPNQLVRAIEAAYRLSRPSAAAGIDFG